MWEKIKSILTSMWLQLIAVVVLAFWAIGFVMFCNTICRIAFFLTALPAVLVMLAHLFARECIIKPNTKRSIADKIIALFLSEWVYVISVAILICWLVGFVVFANIATRITFYATAIPAAFVLVLTAVLKNKK